ncbi:MAG: rhodanese-like domain-containing protein [Hyphomicrobium sp.]
MSSKCRTTVSHVAILTTLWAALGALTLGPARSESPEFARVRTDVTHRWPGVSHLSPDDFAKEMSAGSLVLDVRSPEEYSVSHLAGAVRVDPTLSSRDFLTRFGKDLAGRNVLVYCSVGVRSSKLATTIAEGAKASGAKGVANLAGGIFGWHNEARPLVDANGPTEHVHAFSPSWGKILSRPELIRTEPPKTN